jgi:hypothetical protein
VSNIEGVILGKKYFIQDGNIVEETPIFDEIRPVDEAPKPQTNELREYFKK